MIRKNLLVVIFFSFGLVCLNAAPDKSSKKNKGKNKKEVVATPVPKMPLAKNGDLKSYNEVITSDAKSCFGLFAIHSVKGKYYFEIPDSLMGRDILVVNRIAKAPANIFKMNVGYPGDHIGENVIRFEKAPGNKIFIRNISFLEQAKDTLGMYQSVLNSNVQPIVASFDIKTVKNDTISKCRNSVIDMSDFLNSDNDVFFFGSDVKKRRGIGNLFRDRSYIDTVKSYPINIEIKTVKTYAQVVPKGSAPSMIDFYPNGPITYELNSSMVLLPKEPMKPRFLDSRVGYFGVSYTDFDSNPQGIVRRAMITRWRLEPKDEDIQKYLKGELVEPKKPIVFYIDPATPKKWVPYLIAGVNDWQKAFEQAGFKNAIYALEAPENDPAWSLEDATHSAIIYKPSEIPNASGPHVHDPRSGEIIETHVNWYHNVMSLLRNWYMIQVGPLDAGARKAQFDDELMGQLIRFVSSHEVGHTLGLRHNFGSSATVPVENLRNKAWVEANGHTPSIMDYARFNYVAQPEDNISREGLFPRIGMYDKWAIEWGYRYMPQFATADGERSYLNKWIIEKLAEDKRYTFGTESDPSDPRNQNEDLGDNAMLANTYGVKNLQRIVPNILEWTREPNKGYQFASTIYSEVVGQYSRYMGHVAKNVGGIYNTPRTVEEKGVSCQFVPASIQKDAIAFLNKQLFSTPAWLIDRKLIELAAVEPVRMIETAQKQVVDRLISKWTLDKMFANEAINGNQAYTASAMFSDMNKNVWSELYSPKPIDIYRRNLQKNYIAALIKVAYPKDASGRVSVSATDAANIARTQLYDLQKSIRSAAGSSAGTKRSHLQGLLAQIDAALETGK